MILALTRDVSSELATSCELTYREREPIDIELAAAQHNAYCDALRSLGVEVIRMPALPGHADACFVEDAALVFDELAVLTRMGAVSRRGESSSVGDALSPFRAVIAAIGPPGTLDGGDVLVMGKRIFVGRTQRTSDEGIQSLRSLVQSRGYVVTAVEVSGCLHLKSAVTAIDNDTVLANRAWFDAVALGADIEVVDAPRGEEGGANVARIGPSLLAHSGYPRTRDLLEARGHRVVTVDVSEFIKAEAAVTCKSLIFAHPVGGPEAA
jgi:dimethylargininase